MMTDLPDDPNWSLSDEIDDEEDNDRYLIVNIYKID